GGGDGEIEVDDAGTDPGGLVVRVYLVDLVHPLGRHHDAARVGDCTGGQTGSGSPGNDGDSVLGGDPDDSGYLGGCIREDDHVGGTDAGPCVFRVEMQGEPVHRDPVGTEQGLQVVEVSHRSRYYGSSPEGWHRDAPPGEFDRPSLWARPTIETWQSRHPPPPRISAPGRCWLTPRPSSNS